MKRVDAKRLRLFVVLLAVPLAAPLCPRPPAPPVPAVPTTGTAISSFFRWNATVTPVGPPVWTYVVVSPAGAAGSFPFKSVEIISAINMNDCSVTTPTPGWVVWTAADGTPLGVKEAAAGTATSVTATFSVSCDHSNGPIYLIVDRGLSATPLRIGPIAGPV